MYYFPSSEGDCLETLYVLAVTPARVAASYLQRLSNRATHSRIVGPPQTSDYSASGVARASEA
jgi:hypothetical protein